MHVAYIAVIFIVLAASPAIAAALPMKEVKQEAEGCAERAELPAASASIR
jgi:hypothetical protein